MIAPLLGFSLLVLLTGLFVMEARHNNERTYTSISGRLEKLSYLSNLQLSLTKEHVALFDLLQRTDATDKKQLEDLTQQRLSNLKIERTKLLNALNGSSVKAHIPPEMYDILMIFLEDYQTQINHTVALNLVDHQSALGELVIANEQFLAYNQAFNAILSQLRTSQIDDLKVQFQHSWKDIIIVGVLGMAAALSLLGLAVWLSRLLTRSLEKQLSALVQLGEKAGASFSNLDTTNPMHGMGVVIESFDEALQELNDKEKELLNLNKQLQQHKTNLETRVQERTHELEERGKELRKTITELKETQSSLIQAEKMAALGGLVAGVAHEINTPLGIGVTASSHIADSIITLRETYESGAITQEDLENFLNTSDEAFKILSNNLTRAAELVQSFKQVAVDQNAEEIRFFNICEYINSVVLSLKPQLKKAQHTINIACDETLEIETLPGAFGQILTNLISNSIIHAYDPGQKGEITIRLERQGNNYIHLRYHDDGKGIADDLIGKVFDPFVTTKRGQGGTGLGLNIVYEIIRQKLGGTISCTSPPGEGTLFEIAFKAETRIHTQNAISA